MNSLEYLGLDIVRTFEDNDFLIGKPKISNLKHLNLLGRIFSFEQFAWLKSKMPNKGDLMLCLCLS